METTQTLTKIIEALLKSQKEIENVKKEAENPYFKSKYADLNSLIEACKKILNDNGILILQPINGEFVETTLFHTSGESISSKTKIVSKSDNNPQDQGSAITYARRYGLQSMLFMSAEDDDGEKATDHKSERENGVKTSETVKPTTDTSLGKCPKCGAPMKLSQQGKKYCSALCWKNTVPVRIQEEEDTNVPEDIFYDK